MAWAAVRSKAVVLLLLIYCLMNIALLVRVPCLFLCITLCQFEFCNHLEEEETAGCFAITVSEMHCYYKWSVILPNGVVGWSAVCDCGIS